MIMGREHKECFSCSYKLQNVALKSQMLELELRNIQLEALLSASSSHLKWEILSPMQKKLQKDTMQPHKLFAAFRDSVNNALNNNTTVSRI